MNIYGLVLAILIIFCFIGEDKVSIKKQRVNMLIALNNSLSDIERDAKNQTPDKIESNMRVLQEHVNKILALDGIASIPVEKAK